MAARSFEFGPRAQRDAEWLILAQEESRREGGFFQELSREVNKKKGAACLRVFASRGLVLRGALPGQGCRVLRVSVNGDFFGLGRVSSNHQRRELCLVPLQAFVSEAASTCCVMQGMRAPQPRNHSRKKQLRQVVHVAKRLTIPR